MNLYKRLYVINVSTWDSKLLLWLLIGWASKESHYWVFCSFVLRLVRFLEQVNIRFSILNEILKNIIYVLNCKKQPLYISTCKVYRVLYREYIWPIASNIHLLCWLWRLTRISWAGLLGDRCSHEISQFSQQIIGTTRLLLITANSWCIWTK